MINRIWPLSFGRKITNKIAISERGWNPLNRHLLIDPDIIKTRSTTIISFIQAADSLTEIAPVTPTNLSESVTSSSTNTAPGFSASTCSTIDTEVIPSPWIDLQNMNFDRGLAGEFTIDILQHIAKKEKVRENLNSRYDEGRAVRGMIDRTRRLTGGNMFSSNHIVCDEEVLNIREGKEKEKSDQKESRIRKAIDECN